MTDDRREDVRRLEDQEVALEIEGLKVTQAKTLDVLLGAEDTWGQRQHKNGLVHKVEKIEAHLTNGGIKVKLPAGLWALLIAITSVLGGVGIALIQSP